MGKFIVPAGLSFKPCDQVPSEAMPIGTEKGWDRYWSKIFDGQRSAHGFVFAVYRPDHNRHKLYRLKKKGHHLMIEKAYVAPITTCARAD